MKPIGKYITVSNIEEETKTGSGLILSGSDMDNFRYKRGQVIAVGTDVKDIKPDDKIYYDKAQSFTMLIKDVQCTVLREADVVIVED